MPAPDAGSRAGGPASTRVAACKQRPPARVCVCFRPPARAGPVRALTCRRTNWLAGVVGVLRWLAGSGGQDRRPPTRAQDSGDDLDAATEDEALGEEEQAEDPALAEQQRQSAWARWERHKPTAQAHGAPH